MFNTKPIATRGVGRAGYIAPIKLFVCFLHDYLIRVFIAQKGLVFYHSHKAMNEFMHMQEQDSLSA